MSTEKFCLKWNDFESNISVAFRDIRDQSEFFDVTLACEDNQIEAHKVILSACSPFFRGVLKRNPHQHPLLFLKGIKFADLESVLSFMYHGEVNVAQDQLNSFLQVAEDLRVKGLTQNKNGEKSEERISPSPVNKSRAPPDRDPGGSAPKRPRTSLPHPPTQQGDDDDIQEVVPVKSEPRDVVPAAPPPPPTSQQQQDYQQALVQQEDYSMEEEYEDYDQYQDGGYQGHNQKPDKELSAGELGSDLSEYIVHDLATKKHGCKLCKFVTNRPAKVRYHLEAMHFRGEYTYNCPECDKTYQGRNALSCHMSQAHSKGNKDVNPADFVFNSYSEPQS